MGAAVGIAEKDVAADQGNSLGQKAVADAMIDQIDLGAVVVFCP
jgi:hypothetical protein